LTPFGVLDSAGGGGQVSQPEENGSSPETVKILPSILFVMLMKAILGRL
jgi:hypothetical protein